MCLKYPKTHTKLRDIEWKKRERKTSNTIDGSISNKRYHATTEKKK